MIGMKFYKSPISSKTMRAVFIISLILLISTNAWAHHPPGGAILGKTGPIRTIAPSTLQQDKWAIAIQTEFINFDAFSDGELKGFAGGGKNVHSIDSIFHTIFGLGYGITKDITLSLKIPYAYLNNIREAHQDEPDEVHVYGDAKGIGDITIFGQYRFVKMLYRNFESSLLIGLKMPTGRITDRDINGERFETEFQPGSGSWNPIVGIAATKQSGQLSLDTDVLYTIATKGAQETDLGDLLNYDIALSYQVLNKKVALDLVLEANGEWKGKQKVAGIKDENSGENVIFLSPGMRLSWNYNKWSAFISVGFPVSQDLNGIQNETNMRTAVGISVGL